MVVIYSLIGLLFISAVLSIPMLRKPLSEDEGNWYYPAVFLNRGVRLYKNFHRLYGYFDIHWIAAKIYNLINFKNLRFFQYFKAVWYSLTAFTVYWLTYCLWHDSFISFTAAFIFIVITVIPNTLFVLTYGEHFFILPINLSIISSYYGMSTDNNLYFLLAGLMSGGAVQIKPTALLFSVFLSATCLLSSNYFITTVNYLAGFLSLTLIPLLILRKYGAKSMLSYVGRTFGPLVVITDIIFKRLSLPFLNLQINNLGVYLGVSKDYIKNQHDKSIKVQWSSFKRFMLPAIKDLYLILILAAVQVPYLFIRFDLLTFSMILLFVIFLLMQQAQKNYYTPHFNPCWAPISILAAKTVCDVLPYLTNRGIFGWTIIALVGYGLSRIGRIIVKSFSKREINSFGHLDPLFGKAFRLCESVGEFIQQNSNENEKLFVWGDQPSLYLYAKREAFDTNYLFIYAHQEQIHMEKELINSLREKPPELLIFYNYKVLDGWNIKRLQETIGIPYNLMKSFQVTDDKRKNRQNPQGIVFDFPLYRRDDAKYKEILLDRAMIAQMNKDVNETRRQLENILEISPEDYEASIRLSLLKQNIVESKTVQSYLEEKLAENHDSNMNPILLRLLAEMDVDAGDLDSAVKYYEKALDSNPNDFRVHNGLGELSFSIGKTETALKSFKKAIELHPYSSDVLNNIGVLLSQSGKRDDAIKYFQKALSFMPSHPDARKNMEALI